MAIVRSESDMGLQRARAGAFSPVSESALLASAAIEYPDVEYLIGKLPTEESCAHQCHSDNHQACDLEWSRLPGQLPLVEAGDAEVGYAGGTSVAFFGRLCSFGIIPDEIGRRV